MKVTKNTVVGIDYTLTDDTGSVFETTVGSKPLYFIHGAGTMVRGIERATEGLKTGDKRRVLLTPSDGYGQRYRNRVFTVPTSTLSGTSELRVGMRIQLTMGKKNALFTVMNKSSKEIVLDGNHPLAGLNLLVNIEVVSVREATQAEVNGLAQSKTALNNKQLFLPTDLRHAV